MCPYNSSELWDTTLAVQALTAAGREDKFVERAAHFIVDSQVRADVPDRRRYYRDPSRGGWPFSTRPHGWPVADCTGEGLAASITLGAIGHQAILDAVDLLLRWQNPDGGWPVYERRRAGRLLEVLNPSEVFANTMVDQSFVELTASAMHGLAVARPLVPERRARLDRALKLGGRFIRRRQRPDGSWEGSWGICFTYGTWFALRGLRTLEPSADDPALRRATQFLLDKQLPDGGWGESWESCTRREYVQHPDGSQPVMTAWALLALMEARASGARAAIERAAQFLLDRQLDTGDWPQRSVTGIFARTCALDYRFYRNVFPIWALAVFTRDVT
jgi:squalene/oxidosqualene cyclase-like protein